MSEFPEYDWVQRSIDMTLSEVDEARDLSERLKEIGQIKRNFYYFPSHVIKNPLRTVCTELKAGEDTYILEYLISKN